MVRNPFGRFGNIPRPLFAGLFWVAFLSLGADLPAERPPAKPKAEFAGKWDGMFVDDQKRTGKGAYDFQEDKNGQLSVAVTWWDKASGRK